jgi:6-pyruvoyltetrahydropterin/6-carboxytetrahydropterin synthase
VALERADPQGFGHPVSNCYLSKTLGFEAAYHPAGPGGHDTQRLHGHSFTLEASLCVPLDQADAGQVEFRRLCDALAAITSQLDHALLNDLEGLENPHLMQLCQWVATRLSPEFAMLNSVKISILATGEHCFLSLQPPDQASR